MISEVTTYTGTAAELAAANPTPRKRDRWEESDTGQYKIGDGTTAFNSLAYASAGGGSGTAGVWSAADHAFVAWSFDPAFGASTIAIANGTLYVARMKMAAAAPITNVVVPVTSGTGITASYVAVYNAAGTQIGVSADQGTAWASAGVKTVPLTTPTASQALDTNVLVAILATGASVTIQAAATANRVNQGTTQPLARYMLLAGQTTPPSTLTGMTNAAQPALLFLS